ncbi:hypothetical protein KBC03_01795 [Patescibacteria group bacterium]|nr:hypothetical protein [Patescibacteria group bacterium]
MTASAQITPGQWFIVENLNRTTYEIIARAAYPGSLLFTLDKTKGQVVIRHPYSRSLEISYYENGHEQFNVGVEISYEGVLRTTINEQYVYMDVSNILYDICSYMIQNYPAPPLKVKDYASEDKNDAFWTSVSADKQKRERLKTLLETDGALRTIKISPSETLKMEGSTVYRHGKLVWEPYPKGWYYKDGKKLFEFDINDEWEQQRFEFRIHNKGAITYAEAAALIQKWADKI